MNRTVLPGSLSGTLRILPSKSASHRAVMMAAMTGGETTVFPLQLSRDIKATLSCAQALGLCAHAALEPDGHFLRAHIGGGETPSPSDLRTLDCGESGSTLRFFIPLALDGCGPVRFIGHGRLMQRPLTLYADLFRPRGIRFVQDGDTLTVDGTLHAGEYALRGDVSSQFITGLLLALPRLSGDSVLRLTTALESRAYVELTRQAQAAFGIVSHWDKDALYIPGGQIPHSPGILHVEGDWSHAAFYLVAGAIGQGSGITLTGLEPNSMQGDRDIVRILREMGASITFTQNGVHVQPTPLHGVTVDASQIPDLVPVLAVAMAGAQGVSRITGAGRLRIKESDRLSAITHALCAAGAQVEELADGLVITGGKALHAAAINGCNDHRIVMAMAVACALSTGPLTLSDAEATAKSAPDFFTELTTLGGALA